MSSIRDGAHRSIVECQHQFRHNRWNCSTASRGNGAFGGIAQKGENNVGCLLCILHFFSKMGIYNKIL